MAQGDATARTIILFLCLGLRHLAFSLLARRRSATPPIIYKALAYYLNLLSFISLINLSFDLLFLRHSRFHELLLYLFIIRPLLLPVISSTTKLTTILLALRPSYRLGAIADLIALRLLSLFNPWLVYSAPATACLSLPVLIYDQALRSQNHKFLV